MTLNRMAPCRRVRVVAVAVPAFMALAATAPAQTTPTTAGPFTVDGYYSRYELDGLGDDRVGMNGIGARLMWYPTASATTSDDSPFVSLGLFAEYAPAQDVGFSMVHAGLQGDLNLVRTPLYNRVVPILSLGAGVLKTDLDNPIKAEDTGFALARRSMTSLALTPAIGARVSLGRQLGLRADLRDVVTFKDGSHNNLQFAAGLSLPF